MVLTYAEQNGLIESNPAFGIKVKGAKKRNKTRLPYTTEDLNLIFSGPVHKDGSRPKGGGGEAAYWLPLIALYGGMRMEEIGQLLTTDLKQEGAVCYFDVSDEGAKSLKTESSLRRVPVHPVLIDLGLIEYATGCPAPL